jgi:hypothetical protein
MKERTQADHLARENILNLLSDNEVASVSHLEASPGLLGGEEYLDLAELDQGVGNAFATSSTPMGQVLPRRAVNAITWEKILRQVAVLRISKARSPV